eukprot:CAMPEP_0206139048 /NCGR_PEP_ID=MMETSP1473-20131121/4524_1 /ASSEMBLY_ACC=CAM_ASM_001109 /TAXON_ID=1461547 /ORGANISM="Stichococcus sp, Strain RCC1054" /LENGTH=52 /DNA_ID=CAMNT_0053532665 /DNA_START=602 /DNA_END=760 /DNA_ORIENTATION=-
MSAFTTVQNCCCELLLRACELPCSRLPIVQARLTAAWPPVVAEDVVRALQRP